MDEILRPLEEAESQIQAAGQNLEDYRICALCLLPIGRFVYDEHMNTSHGYEVLHIYPLDP